MLAQFFEELVIPGCMVQLGTEKTVMKSAKEPVKEIDELFKTYREGNNLFFLGGVKDDENKKYSRARDEDVIKKNYFYLDLDIRKQHPELTDEQIKTETLDWVRGVLTFCSPPLCDWRYIVFTGNGLHIYYFGDTIEITDRESWRLGISHFLDLAEEAFSEEFDRACVNPSRIARLPGSINCKTKVKKKVEILEYQDKKINLESVIEHGKKAAAVAADAARKLEEKVRADFPDASDTYNAIGKLPVSKIMCMLTGWVMEPDGIHFTEAGKRDRKGCFVSNKGNHIIQGGTSHLPPSKNGYSPFELVKAFKKLDNHQTFMWFKDNFPEIKKLSEAKRIGVIDLPQDYGIKTVFQELREAEVHQLSLGTHWDEWRLLLRGKVTRIGAMPGTGKSKLGYFLTNLLIKKEYRGLFFSTEVSSADVLAHMLQIRMRKPYLDILEHRVDVPAEIEDDFRNLKVFDVRHTGNMLSRMEQIIKREHDKAEATNMRGLDFIVVDFSQQVTPKSGRYTDIFTWAMEWGNQCQEIAQKYDVAFIDVCQLSVKGNKDEDEKFGHVPYEGGNKLVQTADIASMLSRDKSLSQNSQVVWDIRKSKSMGRRFRLDMEYEWNTGEFALVSAQDSRQDDEFGGLHNYRVQ